MSINHINQINLAGNVGSIKNMCHFQSSNSKVLEFSLAVSANKQSDASWYTIKAWGRLAEAVEKYAKKGSKMAIQGEIEKVEAYTVADKYTKEIVTKYSIVITLKEFQLMDTQGVESQVLAA